MEIDTLYLRQAKKDKDTGRDLPSPTSIIKKKDDICMSPFFNYTNFQISVLEIR